MKGSDRLRTKSKSHYTTSEPHSEESKPHHKAFLSRHMKVKPHDKKSHLYGVRMGSPLGRQRTLQVPFNASNQRAGELFVDRTIGCFRNILFLVWWEQTAGEGAKPGGEGGVCVRKRTCLTKRDTTLRPSPCRPLQELLRHLAGVFTVEGTRYCRAHDVSDKYREASKQQLSTLDAKKNWVARRDQARERQKWQRCSGEAVNASEVQLDVVLKRTVKKMLT